MDPHLFRCKRIGVFLAGLLDYLPVPIIYLLKLIGISSVPAGHLRRQRHRPHHILIRCRTVCQCPCQCLCWVLPYIQHVTQAQCLANPILHIHIIGMEPYALCLKAVTILFTVFPHHFTFSIIDFRELILIFPVSAAHLRCQRYRSRLILGTACTAFYRPFQYQTRIHHHIHLVGQCQALPLRVLDRYIVGMDPHLFRCKRIGVLLTGLLDYLPVPIIYLLKLVSITSISAGHLRCQGHRPHHILIRCRTVCQSAAQFRIYQFSSIKRNIQPIFPNAVACCR